MFSYQSLSTAIGSPSPSRKNSQFSPYPLKNPKDLSTLLSKSSDFDIFDFLTKIKSAQIFIPETLIELSKSEVYFLYPSNGKIKINQKNPCQKFFDFPQNPNRVPRYIHITPTEIQIFHNEKDAIQCWNSYRGFKHRIQRFIAPEDNIPQKLRVHWRANKSLKGFLIKNQEQFTVTQPKRFNLSQKKSSGHLHNLNKFPYAGQIFTSSFSAFLPNKATIPEKDTKTILSRMKCCTDPNKFVAKLSNPLTTVEEVQCEELITTVEELVTIFNENRETKDKKKLSEGLFDFIQESHKWVLVKVKYIKLDYLPSKILKNPLMSPQMLKKIIVDSDLVEKIFSGITKSKKFNGLRLTQANLLQRLNKIENKSNLIKNSGLAFVDMKEIEQRNVQNYKRFSPSVMIFPNILKEESEWYINEAVKQYDEFRRTLKSSFR